jgi:hypothetical protein
VLGWGAWQAHTHASVMLAVHDHAARDRNRLWVDATQGTVELRDAQGGVLAQAVLTPPHGLPTWTGPAGAVDCRAQERAGGDAWRRCWEAQSRWVARWAPRAATAQVRVEDCSLESVPIEQRRYTDWWLWWVPLPHVGGTASTSWALGLHIDSARCAAVETSRATPPAKGGPTTAP